MHYKSTYSNGFYNSFNAIFIFFKYDVVEEFNAHSFQQKN